MNKISLRKHIISFKWVENSSDNIPICEINTKTQTNTSLFTNFFLDDGGLGIDNTILILKSLLIIINDVMSGKETIVDWCNEIYCIQLSRKFVKISDIFDE